MMGVGAKRALGFYRSCAPRQLIDAEGTVVATSTNVYQLRKIGI